jgi:hypothetical protein
VAQLRATTTHDSLRPEGTGGPVTLIAQGRDLYTAADGTATVLAAARIDATASSPENILESIVVDPAQDRLRALVGRRASSGFRRAVDELLPGEADLGTVRTTDDMPISAATRCSPATPQAGARRCRGTRLSALPNRWTCACWVSDAASPGMAEGIRRTEPAVPESRTRRRRRRLARRRPPAGVLR